MLETFLRALHSWHRRRTREWLGFADAETGTVTVIQRFGSALNLNVHFHLLALDGVYAPAAEQGIRFHALPAPETVEVAKLLAIVSHRILRLLARCGRLRETEDGYTVVSPEESASEREASELVSCPASSVRGRIALGRRAGGRVRRLGDYVEVEWGGEATSGEPSRPLARSCAERREFSLHADVCVGAHDRV